MSNDLILKKLLSSLNNEEAKKYVTKNEKTNLVSTSELLNSHFNSFGTAEQSLLLNYIEENLTYITSNDRITRIEKGFKVNTGGALTLAQLQFRKPNSQIELLSIDLKKNDTELLLQEIQQRILKGESNFKIAVIQRNNEHWSSAFIHIDKDKNIKVFQFDSVGTTNKASVLDMLPDYFPNALRFKNKDVWQNSQGSCGLFSLDIINRLTSVEKYLHQKYQEDLFSYLKENTVNYDPKKVNEARLPMYLARTMQSVRQINHSYLNDSEKNQQEMTVPLGKKQELPDHALKTYFTFRTPDKEINSRIEAYESIKMLKHNTTFIIELFKLGVSADAVKEILSLSTVYGSMNRTQKVFLANKQSLILYYVDLINNPKENVNNVIEDLIKKNIINNENKSSVEGLINTVIQPDGGGGKILRLISLLVNLSNAKMISDNNITHLKNMLSEESKKDVFSDIIKVSFLGKALEYMGREIEPNLSNPVYEFMFTSFKKSNKKEDYQPAAALLNILRLNHNHGFLSTEEFLAKFSNKKTKSFDSNKIVHTNAILTLMQKNEIEFSKDNYSFFTSLNYDESEGDMQNIIDMYKRLAIFSSDNKNMFKEIFSKNKDDKVDVNLVSQAILTFDLMKKNHVSMNEKNFNLFLSLGNLGGYKETYEIYRYFNANDTTELQNNHFLNWLVSKDPKLAISQSQLLECVRLIEQKSPPEVIIETLSYSKKLSEIFSDAKLMYIEANGKINWQDLSSVIERAKNSSENEKGELLKIMSHIRRLTVFFR